MSIWLEQLLCNLNPFLFRVHLKKHTQRNSMLEMSQQFMWENPLSFTSFKVVRMNSWLMHALTMTGVFCCRDALSCPTRCTCHFSAKTTEADARLSLFPGDGLPGNTTSLTIQFSNLSVLTAQHLTAVPLLEELHLPPNKLSSYQQIFWRAFITCTL